MNTQIASQEQQANPTLRPFTTRRPEYKVQANKEGHTVEVFLPGVSKDKVTITLNGDELLIQAPSPFGERNDRKLLHQEISAGVYELRLNLNVDVDREKISAQTDNGILSLSLPSPEEALPKKITVN